MVVTTVFDDLVESLTSGVPSEIANFKVSEKDQKRMDFLLKKKQTNKLTYQERQEHEHWIMLIYLARIFKSKARLHLSK